LLHNVFNLFYDAEGSTLPNVSDAKPRIPRRKKRSVFEAAEEAIGRNARWDWLLYLIASSMALVAFGVYGVAIFRGGGTAWLLGGTVPTTLLLHTTYLIRKTRAENITIMLIGAELDKAETPEASMEMLKMLLQEIGRRPREIRTPRTELKADLSGKGGLADVQN
jgi:hypothetical protein